MTGINPNIAIEKLISNKKIKNTEKPVRSAMLSPVIRYGGPMLYAENSP